MRRLYSITTMLCSLLFVGCSALFSTTTLAPNDLYRTDNREVVVSRLEAQAALEQERIAEWEALQAAANASQDYNTSGYSSIVADSYESAYARRLNGFNSPTYKLPSSYYNLLGNSTMFYATAYDPSLYNIMVSGDEVWVEPKYITSMFGSWGATNLSFGIYASPWNYGWGYYADPFYYSWWGYPRYSWYDWNWNICYNPWHYDWYWGYPAYPHYHHHHHYHPGHGPSRPPQHRPTVGTGGRPDHGYVTTGSGASAGPIYGNLNGGRGSSGSRYTSPTSNRNYGSTTITTRPGRGGTISTGVNTNSQYQPSGLTDGGSTRPATNGGTSRGTTTIVGGGSNFRQNSTSTGTTGGSRSTGSVSSGTTSTSRGGSASSGSSSGSYRGTSSSRGSYGGSSTGGSSSGSSSSSRSGGSTSSRR